MLVIKARSTSSATGGAERAFFRLDVSVRCSASSSEVDPSVDEDALDESSDESQAAGSAVVLSGRAS